MNKTKVAIGIGVTLAVLAVLTASAAADNEVYFDPDPSCVAPDETTVVTLRMNITDGVASLGCDVYFNLDVVNITSGAPGDLPTMWLFSHRGDWVRFGGWSETYLDLPPGDYKLADLTLVANNTGTSPLDFCPVWSLLSDQLGNTVPTTWNNGTFNCPCSTPGEFTKELVSGWNLISLPLTATDMTVSNVIDTSLTGSYNELYKYDASAHNFVPLSPTSEMENGVGYFIHMTSGDTWTYSGTAYTPMNVGLKEGLNMIGWLNCTKEDISDALSSIEGDYWYAARWNADEQKFEVFNPVAPSEFNHFSDMERGEGYFVSAKSETTLSESC